MVVKNDFVREYFNVFIRLVQYENYPPKLLDLKIYELLVLLNAFPTDPLFISGRPDGGSDSKIFSVVTQHLTQNLSLDDLANLAGASMATFKREFRRQFNSSARQWILKQRLDKASRILKYSDRSVKEIAFSCGFNDPSYFIKTFRRSYGYTPDAYRAMQYD